MKYYIQLNPSAYSKLTMASRDHLKNVRGAEEMPQQLRTVVTFTEDPGPFSAPTLSFTSTHESISMGSVVFL